MQEIITLLTTVANTVFGVFTDVLSTLMANMLFVVPIVLSIFGGLVMFAIKKIRSMGLKAGGGRRRRR